MSMIMQVLIITACATNATPPPTATPIPTTIPTNTPTPRPIETPQARGLHAMTYDTESHQVILFGGQTGDSEMTYNMNGETWSFDVATSLWQKMSPGIMPAPAAGGDMTYDSRADRAILVIGADATAPRNFDYRRSQTWAYDFNSDSWTQLADIPNNGNVGPAIAYDSESDKTILFGGFTFVGGYSLLDETLAYDYKTNTWTQMQPATSPEPRNFHRMVYASKIDRIVLFGGDDGVYTSQPVWLYDFNSNSWEQLTYQGGPKILWNHGFIYDDKADRFILYGGSNAGMDETWVYDLNANTWAQMQPTMNPGKLTGSAMVYLPDLGEAFLFGGQMGSRTFNYVANTWIYDLNTNAWNEITPDD
jgi:hypothetical protein